MAKSRGSADKAKAGFLSEIAAHVRQAAAAAGLEVDATRVSAVLDGDVLVMASGAEPRATKDGGRIVGFIHISTPEHAAFRLEEKNVKLAAGNYLVEFGKDGSIRLRGVGGGGAIAIAPADTVPQDTGGGPLKCGTSTRIVIRGYPGGKICLYLVCEGTWWYPLGCFTIRPPKFPWPF